MSNQAKKKMDIPVLPLRDIVVFPHMVVPLFVGRDKSLHALEAAMRSGKNILAIAQKDPGQDDPAGADLYNMGTVCKILQLLKMPDGSVKVLVEGQVRAEASAFQENNGYLSAKAETIDSSFTQDDELTAQQGLAVESFIKYKQMNADKIPDEVVTAIQNLEGNPAQMADTMAAHMQIKLEKRQELLEETDIGQRFEIIWEIVEGELGVLEAQKNVKKRTKESIDKTQREYFLREQRKAIDKELGEDDENEVEELEKRIAETQLSEEALKAALKEIKKLKTMSPMSAEATVSRNYLDALLSYPWGINTEVNYDLDNARAVLDKDHYGLDKVKQQVIENLAVQERLDSRDESELAESDILCLVGPPGVGKTSICKSLAEATGRSYERMSVGGVRDEAEIRGHRRTYIGSKVGKIIEKVTKAGSENLLLVVDEIDKMGSDPHRGDPSAAMLEVLDPEQNKTFEDHYLGIAVDLSKVKFVCTANVWGNIPGPLRDRMEVVFLGSYTEDEKLEIAKRHLVRKQCKAHGLSEQDFQVSDDALRALIRHYTKESGVRTLQREVKNLCRKAVVEIKNGSTSVSIDADNLEKYAGKKKFSYDAAEQENEIGMVTGLAYTDVGGETLTIEAVKWPEKGGKFIVTGSLGDVMKESIQVAEGWLKAKAGAGELGDLKIEDILDKTFRVHVPEGATPKDGPSAGAAMLTAIFSVAAQKPIRSDIAMTGELSLRGRVTAIGGLREKLSAASRAGYKTVLIPKENEKDLDEVPQQVKDALEIIPVSRIEEVLEHAIVGGFHPETLTIQRPVAATQPAHPTPM